MRTEILAPTPKAIELGAKLLLNHEIVGFPTETVYGLAASVFDESAINKIYTVKGRPNDNPLIAHIAELSDAKKIGKNIPKEFYLLAEKFFPGPLTLVVEKQDNVPSVASAGLPTIGIRMPDHPVALALIKATQTPLVAPSANLSGKPSPTTAAHVYEDLKGKIPLVLDGGPCLVGIESTVLDLTCQPFAVLRPGNITAREIESVLQTKINTDSNDKTHSSPKAPGMKYAHYKPSATVSLFYNLSDIAPLEKTMILVEPTKVNAFKKHFPNCLIEPLTAENLFASFRLADRLHYLNIMILVDETIQNRRELMDRINKASKI